MPLEHAEQAERARQFVAEAAALVHCVDSVHVACAARPSVIRRFGDVVPRRAIVGLDGTLKRGMRLAEVMPAPGQVQQSRPGRHDLVRDALGFRADLETATLQRGWLEKSPGTGGLTGELARNTHRIGTGDRVGPLWDDVAKPLEVRR